MQSETQSLFYAYDANGNRTETRLPTGDKLSYVYRGSASLHSITYNEQRITIFKHNTMQREIGRTQGALTTSFTLDPFGRLSQQLARLDEASEAVVEHDYSYDTLGNLTQSRDLRTGQANYLYDSLGQISQSPRERFDFDPAHNIVERESECAEQNRLARYDGVYYQYDAFGNLMTRTLADNTQQHFVYNLKDQLVEATIEHPDDSHETWHYQYDVLGRRVAKYRKGNNNERFEFVWDGSHLVQEKTPTGDYSYIYSHPDSYEPLAQIKKDEAGKQSIAYFHTDQIGIPREMTAENGDLLWHGEYLAWGGLYSENNLAGAHQPFRLRNQYCDKETGLHYNFFRYYDPNCGRFISQDPIGLQGGENFYRFAENATGFVDVLGLANDKTPLNAENCMALIKLIDYAEKNGKTKTIMNYGSFNFSSDMAALDAAFPSRGGLVSVDWMMRSAVYGAGSPLGISFIAYSAAKSWWNIANGTWPWTNLMGEANSNAPSALSAWLYNSDMSLREMFDESLKQCEVITCQSKCKKY